MLLALGEVDLGGGQQAASGHSPLGCASHSFNKTREGNLQQLDDGEEHDTTLVFISPPPLFLSLSLSPSSSSRLSSRVLFLRQSWFTLRLAYFLLLVTFFLLFYFGVDVLAALCRDLTTDGFNFVLKLVSWSVAGSEADWLISLYLL